MSTALITQQPSYQVLDLDPAAAKEILNGNTHNRGLRRSVVESYARDMSEGAWQENGESIKIAGDGTLLDGQHRLNAIVESGATQRMLVVRGLPMGSQDTVDGGARRSFSDVLKLRGETDYNRLAAVTRRVAHWQRGERRAVRSPAGPATNTELLRILDEAPSIRASAEIAGEVRRHIPVHASVAGLTHYLFAQVNPEDCDYFFQRLIDGANLDADHPVAVLRRTVIEHMSGKHKLPEHVMLAYVIKAWNAYRDGRTISQLRFRAGGKNPEDFPEPR